MKWLEMKLHDFLSRDWLIMWSRDGHVIVWLKSGLTCMRTDLSSDRQFSSRKVKLKSEYRRSILAFWALYP